MIFTINQNFKILAKAVTLGLLLASAACYGADQARVVTLPVQTSESQRAEQQALDKLLSTEEGIKQLKTNLTQVINTTEELILSTEHYAKVVADNQSLCEAILSKRGGTPIQQHNRRTCVEDISKLKQEFAEAAMALDSAEHIAGLLEKMLPQLDNSLRALQARRVSRQHQESTRQTCKKLSQLGQKIALVLPEEDKQHAKILQRCGRA